jgi:Chaperone of endosialidase
MNSYNAITNSYFDDDNEVIIPPRIPPVLFNWSNTAKFSEVYTVQQEQNDQLASLQAEQTVQNDAIESLQDGLLQRVHYEQPSLGGAHLLLTPAQEYTDVSTGETGLIPSSAKLETYDDLGVIASAITLQGNLVILEGTLELGTTPDVASLLLEHTTKIHNLEVESAVTTAAELAVEAALAALEAASFLKPPGYTPIEETGTPPETDPNSTSVEPITLAPSGTFQGVDAFGAITHTTVARGKVGINNTFPLRSLDLKGDIRQQATDASDIVELQSLCRLASNVATYDTSHNLTNPTTPAVYLGVNALVDCSGTLQAEAVNVATAKSTGACHLATDLAIYDTNNVLTNPTAPAVYLPNALITVDGTLQAAAVNVDLVTSKRLVCTDICKTNPVKTLHAAQGISNRDVRRDIAIQSIRTSAALREATTPSSISKDLRMELASQSLRVSAAIREATTPSSISKDLRMELASQSLRISASIREAIKPSLISKNYDLVIAQLKSRTNEAQSRAAVTTDYSPKLSRLTNAIISVQRLVKPVFAASYAAVVNTLRAAISVIRQDVRVLKTRKQTVVSDSRPALKRVSDTIVSVNRRVKPTASTDLRPAIQRTNDRISALSTSTTNYTQTLTTSDANNLKVHIGTADQMVVTSSATTINNSLVTNNTSTFNGKIGLDANLLGGATRGISFFSLTDTNWGCYLATVGANKSFANGTTVGYGGVTGYAVRSRCNNSSTTGFIWENSSEVCNMALNASTGNLTVRGLLTPGSISTTGTVATGTLTVADKLITLANTTSDATLLDGGGLQLGTGTSNSSILYNNATTSWVSNRNITAPTLNVSGNTSIIGDSTINGILRVGIPGTTTIAGYQGGTIYFAGPFGDHQDANSGIQCKNYTNGTTSTEATELLLWQLNDPYSDSGPDRIRLYAGEIRFDTYIAGVGAGSQYTESTRMKIMPNGYVGIGETNPRGTLHISAGANTTSTVPNLCVTNGVGVNTSSLPQISFGYNGGRDYNHFITSRHYGGQVAGNSLDFYTCNGLQNNTINDTKYCMSMNGGRVGINKFDPTDQLHVVGNSTFEGVNQCKGTRFVQGAQNSSYGNIINFYWTGSALEAWVDTTKVGNVGLSSDYRIKKDITTLGPSLDKIMKLRPVNYSIKDNGIFKNDDSIQTGFIAHEVQAIIPDGANGVKDKKYKDGLDEPQSLNVMPILSTLVRAVQELTAKVQALEKLLKINI